MMSLPNMKVFALVTQQLAMYDYMNLYEPTPSPI